MSDSKTDAWRSAVAELLRQYPSAQIKMRPHGTSTGAGIPLGRNEYTKNRVDESSKTFLKPRTMGPAMIHREKALMQKKGNRSSGFRKKQHSDWVRELKAINPSASALLESENNKRRLKLAGKQGEDGHMERLRKLDETADRFAKSQIREKVNEVHGAQVSEKAEPVRRKEIAPFRVKPNNQDEPEFLISGEDDNNQRPSLDVSIPKTKLDTPFQRERRAQKRRVEPYGFVWVGSKTRSIYSGLKAENVDHCPSVNYVRERSLPYPKSASKFYVAATAMENATKAHYGAACICEAAAKIFTHFTTRKKYRRNAAAVRTARLIENKWSTSSECPCVLCAASEPLSRWKECLSTGHVKEKMPRR